MRTKFFSLRVLRSVTGMYMVVRRWLIGSTSLCALCKTCVFSVTAFVSLRGTWAVQRPIITIKMQMIKPIVIFRCVLIFYLITVAENDPDVGSIGEAVEL